MKLFLAFLLCLPVHGTEEVNFSYEELELMAIKKQWKELVLRLSSADNVARGEKWEKLVETAVLGFLQQENAEKLADVAKEAAGLLVEFPSLKRSKEFNRFRVGVGFPSIRHCYAHAKSGEECTKRLYEIVKLDRGNVELCLKAAELAQWGHGLAGALPFIELALTESTRDQVCGNQAVSRSLASASQLTNKEAREKSQALVKKYCK